MAKLRRISDGKGDQGSNVQAIKWNKEGTDYTIMGHKPILGCSLRVGSTTGRTYSTQDWWVTTEITSIIEETSSEYGLYVKFKTKNSTYEFWS